MTLHYLHELQAGLHETIRQIIAMHIHQLVPDKSWDHFNLAANAVLKVSG